MIVCGTDVSTAFLNAELSGTDLERGILCRAPSIFSDAGATQRGEVWIIRKALYGLRQSPKQWGLHRDNFLKQLRTDDLEFGQIMLCQTKCDSCVWVIVQVQGNQTAAVLGWIVTYVDDILAVAVRTCGKNIITSIMKHWKCSDMEVLGSGPGEVPQMGFLGMTLCHVPKKGIFVHQMEYVRGLLAKHQMENSNPSKVLLPQEECLDPLEERTLAEARAEDPNWQPNARALKEAQKGAGELLWLATRTRVDMAYTMHRLCSVVSSNPDRANRMVKCVLRYLKGSIDIGILFCNSEELSRMEDQQLTTLAGHCDPNT